MYSTRTDDMQITEDNYNDVRYATAHDDCGTCRVHIEIALVNFKQTPAVKSMTGNGECFGKVYLSN
jgi:hypothetical protein